MPPKKKHAYKIPDPTEIQEKAYGDPKDPNFNCTCKIKDCGGDNCRCAMFDVTCRSICKCAMKCTNV